jgi:hypothetical protein
VLTVEPVVSEEKLRVLLAEQHESATLDYKRVADLGDKRTAVELAKDVAAMQVEGGFIVVGADDRGHPTGLVTQPAASLFDEARLRSKLTKWMGLLHGWLTSHKRASLAGRMSHAQEVPTRVQT